MTKSRTSRQHSWGICFACALVALSWAPGCVSSGGHEAGPKKTIEHVRQGTVLRELMKDLGQRTAVPVPQGSSLAGPETSAQSLEDFASRLAETASLVPCLADELDLPPERDAEFLRLAADLSELSGKFLEGRYEAKARKTTETPYDAVFQAELAAVMDTCKTCHEKFLPQ